VVPDIKEPEELVAYIARVSNPANQLNNETAPKLLSFLIKHKHWSPFEMVDVTFEIVTSRAIAAQILRHRSFSFQEFSQRYANATSLEHLEWRLQGKTNRQVGEEEIVLNDELHQKIQNAQTSCKLAYDALLEQGIAKECARMILPLNTSTTLYMKGNLRSWIHYIDLRSEYNTQKEHRAIAQAIKLDFVNHFPNISQALEWK
jgi:thymidylate synthase (FAD)